MQSIFICFLIPGLALLALVIYSCVLGVQYVNKANYTQGEQAATLRYLALNLCEPIAGIPLTLLTLYLIGDQRLESLPLGFIAIWPMWSLLIPARGFGFQHMAYRRISRNIFGLGALRLLLNGLCFCIPAFAMKFANETYWMLLMIALPIGSIATLMYTVLWARRHFHSLLTTVQTASPPLPSSTTPTTAPTVAARPGITTNLMPVAATLQTSGNYRTATPCTNCGAFIPFKDLACPQCGLIAASRVPEALRNLPRYTVLRPLGTGGMSHIYLAEDRASAAICVLKAVVSPDSSNQQWQREAWRCLEHEAFVLQEVQHPGIVTLLGWYPETPASFMALEYIAGPSLEQRLEAGVLPPAEALRHGATIAEVIAFLAGLKHPIVHCDIKPGNLIAPESGAPIVLVDFGSAIILDGPATQLHREHYGTPGYAAPEQYQHNAVPQSDVYGLAATLYHLLTGDDPTKHPLDFPAWWVLPTEIAAVLTPALERDPALRPTPAVFRDTLQELMTRYD